MTLRSLRFKEKKGRKLQRALQANSSAAECAGRLEWGWGAKLAPGTHLKLPREEDAGTASWSFSYSVAKSPLFLPTLVPDAYGLDPLYQRHRTELNLANFDQ